MKSFHKIQPHSSSHFKVNYLNFLMKKKKTDKACDFCTNLKILPSKLQISINLICK